MDGEFVQKETLANLGLTKFFATHIHPSSGSCVCGEYDWQTIDQVRTQIETNIMGSLTVTKVSGSEHKQTELSTKWC